MAVSLFFSAEGSLSVLECYHLHNLRCQCFLGNQTLKNIEKQGSRYETLWNTIKYIFPYAVSTTNLHYLLPIRQMIMNKLEH